MAVRSHHVMQLDPIVVFSDFDGTLTLENGKDTCEWNPEGQPKKLHQKMFPEGWRETNINPIESNEFKELEALYRAEIEIENNPSLKITQGAQKLIRSVLQYPLNKFVIITRNREDYIRISLRYIFKDDQFLMSIIDRIKIYTVHFTIDGEALEHLSADTRTISIKNKSDAVNDYVPRLFQESKRYHDSNVYVFDDNESDFNNMTNAAKTHFGPNRVKGYHTPNPADYDSYFNSLTIQNNDLVALSPSVIPARPNVSNRLMPAAVSAVHTHSTLVNYNPLSYELLQANFKDLFVYFRENQITPQDSTLNKDLEYFYIRRSNTEPTWLVLSTIRYDRTIQRFTRTSNFYISITSTLNIQLLQVTVYNYSTDINERYFDYLGNIQYYGIKSDNSIDTLQNSMIALTFFTNISAMESINGDIKKFFPQEQNESKFIKELRIKLTISSLNATAFLENSQNGTFILRKSSYPNKLAITYVDNSEKKHTLVYQIKKNFNSNAIVWFIKENNTDIPELYPTIFELIAKCKMFTHFYINSTTTIDKNTVLDKNGNLLDKNDLVIIENASDVELLNNYRTTFTNRTDHEMNDLFMNASIPFIVIQSPNNSSKLRVYYRTLLNRIQSFDYQQNVKNLTLLDIYAEIGRANQIIQDNNITSSIEEWTKHLGNFGDLQTQRHYLTILGNATEINDCASEFTLPSPSNHEVIKALLNIPENATDEQIKGYFKTTGFPLLLNTIRNSFLRGHSRGTTKMICLNSTSTNEKKGGIWKLLLSDKIYARLPIFSNASGIRMNAITSSIIPVTISPEERNVINDEIRQKRNSKNRVELMYAKPIGPSHPVSATNLLPPQISIPRIPIPPKKHILNVDDLVKICELNFPRDNLSLTQALYLKNENGSFYKCENMTKVGNKYRCNIQNEENRYEIKVYTTASFNGYIKDGRVYREKTDENSRSWWSCIFGSCRGGKKTRACKRSLRLHTKKRHIKKYRVTKHKKRASTSRKHIRPRRK